ncbi:MAG: hypothetical protein ABIL02_06940 [candidate division WOR-3 bacterium]
MKRLIFLICLINIFGLADEAKKINAKAVVRAISQYEIWTGDPYPYPTFAFDQKGNLWCLQEQPDLNSPIYDLEENIIGYSFEVEVLSIISPDGNPILVKKVIPEFPRGGYMGIESRALEFDQWGNGLFFCNYMHEGYIFMKVSPEGNVLWWKAETLAAWPISIYKLEDDTIYLISGHYHGKFRSKSGGVDVISFGDEEKRISEKLGFTYEKEPFGASVEMQAYLSDLAQKDISKGRLGAPIFVTPARRILKIEGLVIPDGNPFRYGFWIVSKYIDYTNKVIRGGILALVDIKKNAFRKFKNVTMPEIEVTQLKDKGFIVNFPAQEENVIYQIMLDREGNVIEPEKLEIAKAKRFEDLGLGQRFVQIGYDYYPSTGRLRGVYTYFIGFDNDGMLYWTKYKVK